MFGFIWVLLEKIAARVLRQDIERWRDQMASWKDSVSVLEDKLDVRRSEFIKLKADHDREIESLQQTAREQAKCIEQQTETIQVLKNINAAHEKEADKSVKLSESLRQQIDRLERDNHSIKDRLAKVKRFLDFPS
jgi:hypothetical protein